MKFNGEWNLHIIEWLPQKIVQRIIDIVLPCSDGEDDLR
jgi:hypothetical protein